MTSRATSGYVFEGEGRRPGPLIEPKRQVSKVIAQSGVHFTLHDLRRTFVTTAEGLDIPAYSLKRLVNHRVSTDVTDAYIVSDVERLRGPVQRIADELLPASKPVEASEVVPLQRGAKVVEGV